MALNNLPWLICLKPNQILYIHEDLALYNLQWLIYYKTKPNQIDVQRGFIIRQPTIVDMP